MAWLVIAAAEFELAPLRSICDPSTQFVTFGIGHLQAAREAVRIQDLAVNKDVLYVGTCGRFMPFHSVELVCIRQVQWSCLGERLGLAYKIQNTLPPYQLKPHESLSQRLPSAIALCAASISLDPTLPRSFGDPSQYVENVELYSVAPIVAEKALSFTAVLGVTNALNAEAHQSWRRHFAEAARATSAFLEPYLKG